MNIWQAIAVIAAVLALIGVIAGIGTTEAAQVLAIGSITFAVIGQTAPRRP